jgi:preprotein translocase subunit SecA
MKAVAQETYRRLKVREERTTPAGLDALAFKVAEGWHQLRREGGALRDRAREIEARIAEWEALPDGEIAARTETAAAALLKPRPGSDALIAGVAGTALAARRTLGLTPYPEQLQGALAIFDGYLAEMATGEGKTLTIALAAALMGLTRQPVHVVTANDYLAERDAAELAPFYRFFGLRVDFVTGAKEPADRAAGYAAQVTYTTPKEVLADFLRDRLKIGRIQNSTRQLIRQAGGVAPPQRNLVLRGLHFGIIDEADSVLIDEAITPLIISRPVQDPQLREAMETARRICEKLEPGRHYQVDPRFREVHLAEELWKQLFAFTPQFPPWWRGEERFREAIRLTLTVREFYHRDIHYAVQDGKVEIIDESTGRIMPHRSWQQGIHQAVEVKEGLAFSATAESLASLSFQRFFRCYPRLAGLSGTAREAASELWKNYQLPWVRIPTHRPVIRQQMPTRILRTKAEVSSVVVEEIARLRGQGRPVLVGTRTVRASEELARALTEAGIPFHLLNACRNAGEARIVEEAGQAGQVTIATNMAGRGTDIKLGPGVAQSGGLHVIATEGNASGRLDRQLLGRAGRQGDPGSGQFIVSIDDDLLARYLPGFARRLFVRYFEVPVVRLLLAGWAFSYARRQAEWEGRLQRRKTLEADTWLDENLAFGGRSSMPRLD